MCPCEYFRASLHISIIIYVSLDSLVLTAQIICFYLHCCGQSPQEKGLYLLQLILTFLYLSCPLKCIVVLRLQITHALNDCMSTEQSCRQRPGNPSGYKEIGTEDKNSDEIWL